MNHLILLEHRFIEQLAQGDVGKVDVAYKEFQKDLVSIYRNEHTAHDIHAALMLVEHELEHIIEMCVCPEVRALAQKTLGLVMKFAGNVAELVKHVVTNPVADKVAENSEAEVSADNAGEGTAYKWNGYFTQLVELIDSLLELEMIAPADNSIKEFNASAFIRDIFRLLNINKTPQDFRSARNKLYEKNVDFDKGETRCKLLTLLLANTEQAWEKKYLTKGN